jgi:hypothetical protein
MARQSLFDEFSRWIIHHIKTPVAFLCLARRRDRYRGFSFSKLGENDDLFRYRYSFAS